MEGRSAGAEPGGRPSARPGPPPSHGELLVTFLKISLLGFGGPNAHIALMLDEVVERKGWLGREHFLQLVAVTNLLPGPNSSETAIHVGYAQRGWTGALTTGLAFLVPTFVLVVAFSWLYFSYGSLPAVEPVFRGLKPVVLALIVSAGWRLGRTAVSGRVTAALALVGAAVTLAAGQWAVGAMVAGGAVTWTAWRRRGGGPRDGRGDPPEGAGPDRASHPPAAGLRTLLPPVPASLGLAGVTASLGAVAHVFWTHLWIGSVLFGGGYVLVALLEPYAVGRYGWLTSAQFLDGVALTQAVPGPISTLSAFVGYAAAGLPGAVAGTAGVYLPAFAAVLLVAPHLERLRRTEAVRAVLEGVGAVVAGAILGVALTLAPEAVVGGWTALLFAGSLLALLRWKVPALWLVAAGAAAGSALAALG